MLTLKKPLLRITRGQSQFPLRAIDQKRFLIGAGSSCHLLLTHAKIPMIFALVQPTDDGCTIEAYHPVPPMLVNDDTLAFLHNVDAAMLVAAAGSTTISEIDACERELAAHTSVMGVVLNKCRYTGRDYGSDYY